MPKVRSFEIPTVMKHGLGAVQTLADEAKAMGMKRPMLVTDGGIVKAGLLDHVTNPLKAGHLDFVVFDAVVPNPPIAVVDQGGAVYLQEKCDGVIGVGGIAHDAVEFRKARRGRAEAPLAAECRGVAPVVAADLHQAGLAAVVAPLGRPAKGEGAARACH